jgi:hypothetical protein
MELLKFKQLTGIDIEDKTKDVSLQFVIDDIRETILNYCHLEELPKGLINTAYRMAIDLYRNEAPGEENTPQGTVSSISAGDTTTNFKNTSSEFKDSLLKNYKLQLNRFRKLVF